MIEICIRVLNILDICLLPLTKWIMSKMKKWNLNEKKQTTKFLVFSLDYCTKNWSEEFWICLVNIFFVSMVTVISIGVGALKMMICIFGNFILETLLFHLRKFFYLELRKVKSNWSDHQWALLGIECFVIRNENQPDGPNGKNKDVNLIFNELKLLLVWFWFLSDQNCFVQEQNVINGTDYRQFDTIYCQFTIIDCLHICSSMSVRLLQVSIETRRYFVSFCF